MCPATFRRVNKHDSISLDDAPALGNSVRLLTSQVQADAVTVGGFVEALNVLGTKNVRYVYSDTGQPDFTLVGNHSAEYMADPSNYYAPRRLRLGARILF